jgi:hypothetical protein
MMSIINIILTSDGIKIINDLQDNRIIILIRNETKNDSIRISCYEEMKGYNFYEVKFNNSRYNYQNDDILIEFYNGSEIKEIVEKSKIRKLNEEDIKNVSNFLFKIEHKERKYASYIYTYKDNEIKEYEKIEM